MSFTRKSLADHLDSYDEEISQLQESKRLMLTDYRDQLAQAGMGKAQIKAEVDALKSAMRRRRAVAKKGNDEVDQADALADEIFVEITSRAPRATRTHEATTVLMQEPHVVAEGQGGVMHEHGREEGSHPRLPSDPVENKTGGPSVIAAEPNYQSAATPLPADEPEASPTPTPNASGALSDYFVPAFLKREVA